MEMTNLINENANDIDIEMAGMAPAPGKAHPLEFGMVKDRVCFKLVNTARNRELLASVPHVPFLDMSVVFFVLLKEDMGTTATVRVDTELMDAWGVDVETLFRLAMENTPRLRQGGVASICDVFQEAGLPLEGEPLFPGPDLYVATNTSRLNGACVCLYDGFLGEFADRVGADFYILPSSVHEMLFLPDVPGVDGEYLKQMVRDVNAKEVPPQEVLSNNVYRYNRLAGAMEML